MVLFYKNKRMKENPDHTGNEGYNYHRMWFTNTESDDLRILPTHRLISDLPGFSETDLLENLSKYFNIRELEEPTQIGEVILGKKNAFGILIGEKAFKIRLKPEFEDKVSWKFPDTIKKLDLTIMHYFVLEKSLGILGKDQRSSKNLTFERNFAKCHEEVLTGKAQCAIITKDISIDTVKEVCYSGYTLPQKSTYFYPKAICGFLFSSIMEEEFNSYFDEAFN